MGLKRLYPTRESLRDLDAFSEHSRAYEHFVVLDFDGVVNPEYFGTPPKTFYRTDHQVYYPNPHWEPPGPWGRSKAPKSFELRWSSELLGDVSELVGNKGLLVWLTTWRSWMGGVMDTMGLTVPAVYLPWGGESYDHELKVPALRSVVSSLSPEKKVFWLDDRLEPAGLPANVLFLKPDSRHGVSRAQMAEGKAFLNTP